MYIYNNPNWPDFEWDESTVLETISHVKYTHGKLLGKMESLGFITQKESILATITQDVLKSNEIEGEFLDATQVRSSVARRIGLDMAGLKDPKPHIDAIVKMTMEATSNFNSPLTKERLFLWHKLLLTKTREKIIVGDWRDDKTGPMQVISGVIGRLNIHFEAPPAKAIPREMDSFLDWFNTKHNMDYMIKAAIAHLWFVTLHPFDDGNGRIARVISDMCLARLENSDKRFYSMSSQILIERSEYYNILEITQKGGMDITKWVIWFLNCLNKAMNNTESTLAKVITKAQFWQKYSGIELSGRQINTINFMLDKSNHIITSSGYAKLAKCSQDTAHRDISDLVGQNILLASNNGGRSTSYMINI